MKDSRRQPSDRVGFSKDSSDTLVLVRACCTCEVSPLRAFSCKEVKELARKKHTSVIVASKNIKIAKWIGKMISTKYYIIEFSNDIIGVEIFSAIKNIYAQCAQYIIIMYVVHDHFFTAKYLPNSIFFILASA